MISFTLKSVPQWKGHILYGVVYDEIPPRIEYFLTETGKALIPVLEAHKVWRNEHVLSENVVEEVAQ